MKYRLSILLLLLAIVPQLLGQVYITNQARDFWVMFLPNGGDQRPRTLEITAVGDTTCTITVTNPLTSWIYSATMTASTALSITLPDAAVPNDVNAIDSCGFHITSTSNVSLIASYKQLASTGATLVLPTAVLGTRYVALDYPADPLRSEITGAALGFLAIDTTLLTMTLPCSVMGYEEGMPFSIQLNPGETYVLSCSDSSQSFSGMEVVGTKPFAMFQGNLATSVTDIAPSVDYMYEQAIPYNHWGHDFAVVSTYRGVGDIVRQVSTLVDGEGDTSYVVSETELSSNTAYRIISEHPTSIALCTKSTPYNGEYGDPSLLMFPALDHGVQKASFFALTSQRIWTFYLTIVTRTADAGGMRLDGTVIDPSSFTMIDNEYSYVRLSVTMGPHSLENTTGDFVAWLHGVGKVECYAYPVGVSFSISLPPIHDTVIYFDSVCINQIYKGYGFIIDSSETQTTGVMERWRTETDSNYIHHICLQISVLPSSLYDTTIAITIGDSLFIAGDTLTQPGAYSFHLLSANGCDSLLTVHLLFDNVVIDASDQGICMGESVTLNAIKTPTAFWTSTPPDVSLELQQTQLQVTVSPQQTTLYRIHLYEGGEAVDSVVVHVSNKPSLCVQLSRSYVDFDYPVITLTDCATDHAVATWSFSDGTSISKNSVQHHFDYPLADSVTIHYSRCNDYFCCSDTVFYIPVIVRSIWFPNAFTPGQPTNQYFGCQASFKITTFNLQIYDRHGLLLFSTTDPKAVWDGTCNGQPMPQNAYVYYWFAADDYGYQKNGVGTVTLIR